MLYHTIGFGLVGVLVTAGAEAQQIAAPIRVHVLTSTTVPELNCSYSDDEIRELFAVVNQIWAQAKIHWQLESIIREPAREQERFRKVFKEFAAQDRRNGPGTLSAICPDGKRLEMGWNIFFIEDLGQFAKGNYLRDKEAILVGRRGEGKPLGPRAVAHELGHSLGLEHLPVKQAYLENLMLTASGMSKETSTELAAFQVRRTRRQAQSGRPYSVLEYAESLFRISDRNRDAALTRQEATMQYIESRFAHYDVDNDGRVTAGEHRLGFRLEHLDDGRTTRKMGVARDNTTNRPGFVVGLVVPSAPAGKAGLRVGDRILQIDGKDIETLQDLRRAVNSGERSQEVSVERGEKKITLQLKFPY